MRMKSSATWLLASAWIATCASPLTARADTGQFNNDLACLQQIMPPQWYDAKTAKDHVASAKSSDGDGNQMVAFPDPKHKDQWYFVTNSTIYKAPIYHPDFDQTKWNKTWGKYGDENGLDGSKDNERFNKRMNEARTTSGQAIPADLQGRVKALLDRDAMSTYKSQADADAHLEALKRQAKDLIRQEMHADVPKEANKAIDGYVKHKVQDFFQANAKAKFNPKGDYLDPTVRPSGVPSSAPLEKWWADYQVNFPREGGLRKMKAVSRMGDGSVTDFHPTLDLSARPAGDDCDPAHCTNVNAVEATGKHERQALLRYEENVLGQYWEDQMKAYNDSKASPEQKKAVAASVQTAMRACSHAETDVLRNRSQSYLELADRYASGGIPAAPTNAGSVTQGR